MKPVITICGVADLIQLEHRKFTHVVSIWAAGAPSSVVQRIQKMFPQARCAFAFFDDIATHHDSSAPGVSQIEAILNFTRTLKPDDQLLVHCFAGVSRSAAVALAITSQHAPEDAQMQYLAELQKRHPHIRPNNLIIKLADRLLNKDGDFIKTASAVCPQQE